MAAELSYTYTGQKLSIEIELPYESLKCMKLPENCMQCPNGYMHNCGRNVPFKSEDYIKRPDTCRLKEIPIEELIRKELESIT